VQFTSYNEQTSLRLPTDIYLYAKLIYTVTYWDMFMCLEIFRTAVTYIHGIYGENKHDTSINTTNAI